MCTFSNTCPLNPTGIPLFHSWLCLGMGVEINGVRNLYWKGCKFAVYQASIPTFLYVWMFWNIFMIFFTNLCLGLFIAAILSCCLFGCFFMGCAKRLFIHQHFCTNLDSALKKSFLLIFYLFVLGDESTICSHLREGWTGYIYNSLVIAASFYSPLLSPI